MDNKITITITNNSQNGIDVHIGGKGDNNLIIKAIKGLGGLGESLKSSIVGKRDQLLARIALYNTGKELTKRNEPNKESMIDALSVLNDFLAKIMK
ncbi:MAG: hypothetical protein ACFNWZ_00855 [Candidatus Absconditicoccaceae bacterium]